MLDEQFDFRIAVQRARLLRVPNWALCLLFTPANPPQTQPCTTRRLVVHVLETSSHSAGQHCNVHSVRFGSSSFRIESQRTRSVGHHGQLETILGMMQKNAAMDDDGGEDEIEMILRSLKTTCDSVVPTADVATSLNRACDQLCLRNFHFCQRTWSDFLNKAAMCKSTLQGHHKVTECLLDSCDRLPKLMSTSTHCGKRETLTCISYH